MAEILGDGSVQHLVFLLGAVVALLGAGFFVGRRSVATTGKAAVSKFGNDAAILKLVVEHAHEGLMLQDIYGRIEWSNPAYSRITGYSADEIRGRRPQEFILTPENQLSENEIESFRFDLSKFRSGFDELILNKRKNGEYFWNQLTYAVVEGDTLEDTKIILICRDVTSQVEHMRELEEARNKLKLQAERDDLTGVANRNKLNSFLHERASTRQDEPGLIGIIHCDLDHFKDINDSHGHSAGDTVLCHAAEVLKTVLRGKGLVARIGGDEFIAVVSDPAGPQQMETLGKEILEGLSRPVKVDHQTLSVAGSVGLVLADGSKTGVSELINRADLALYAAKKSGRRQIAWYTDALGAAHRHRRMTMAQLDTDLENGGLTLLLEPQFDLVRERIVGYEASAYWLHPTEGLVDPVSLLSSQEDLKRFAQIERFALSRGLVEVKFLRDTSDLPLFLSVNLTAASIKEPGFLTWFTQLCDDHQFDCRDIVIELDESIVRLDEPDGLVSSLGGLTDLGCQIALDMFGSGHGGAGQLIHLNADRLKLSPGLVKGLAPGSKQHRLVQAIIRLTKNLGLVVSAAGVKTPEQIDMLEALGCTIIQGEAVSAPLSPREAEIHLQDFSKNTRLLRRSEV